MNKGAGFSGAETPSAAQAARWPDPPCGLGYKAAHRGLVDPSPGPGGADGDGGHAAELRPAAALAVLGSG